MIDVKKMEHIKDALIIATIKTFEEMAFIEVIHHTNDSNGTNENFNIKANINIIEPMKCRLIFEVSEKLLSTIVENIYSKPFEELSVKDVNDCLEELLNVLTGNFLIEFYGVKHVYKIELPEIIAVENNINRQKIDIKFSAEGIIFKIIYINEE
jgi:CheY-specific phosphatase CheX